MARDTAGTRKAAPHNNPIVGLQGEREYRVVGPGAHKEAIVHRTVAIEPGQPAADDIIHVGEEATQEHLAVGLQGNRAHGIISARPGIKTNVHRAIKVQPGDAVTRRTVYRCEIAADNNLAGK